jgi:PAS domain S-box-containing protein
MRLKTRLRFNSFTTLAMVFLMILSLAWSLREESKAERSAALASEMERTVDERTVLRDEYLLNQEKRSRIQWQAKSEELARMLTRAQKELTEPEERTLIQAIKEEYDGTSIIFSRLVEIREGGASVEKGHLAPPEGEKRLIGQILIRAYALRDNVHRLGESARRTVAAARERSGLLVVILMGASVIATIGNSAVINSLLARRIAILLKGTAAIGIGNLDHRIDMTGNDELSDLARASNEMAARLKESHTSVEHLNREIAERKRMELEREITIDLLKIINHSTGKVDLVRAAATFFQRQSGCEALGIRLKEGEDYPYFEARGFPREFVVMENSLCARDSLGNLIRDDCGNPTIECMCGNVICRRVDPSKPFFTSGGSFWANDTTRLLATTSDADRQARTRNRCNGEGYESVALIPLRSGAEPLGLIQLNDRRKGMFSPEIIAMWERLAGYLSVALAKVLTEEAMQQKEADLREAQRVSHVGSWYWDAKTDATTGSDELFRIYGFDPAMQLMPGFQEQRGHCYPIEEWERLSAAVRRTLETGIGYRLDVRAFRDGEPIWVTTRSEAVRNTDGQIVGLRGTAQDVTERKRTEEALRDSLEEKVALLKEVHHRVKNNLQIVASLLNLQSNRSNSPEVINVLQDTRNRVGSMALLHETLYRSTNLARINFAAYEGDLCRQLLASFGPVAKRVTVENRIARIGLPLEYSVPCGLIVNELISNALKHGFPGDRTGRIVVEMNPSDGELLVLSVKDDGVGLPPELNLSKVSTLGLRLVSNLARQMRGEVSVPASDGVGAAFNVIFPIPAGTVLEKDS